MQLRAFEYFYLTGEVGNDLTPALLELPISRNHQHGGWTNSVPFFQNVRSAVSASRTYEIFNQNGWGRSLHFLAAWFLVLPGAIYLLAGIFTGHFWRHLVPRVCEFSPRLFWQYLKNHLRLQIRPAAGGPQYGLLQRCAYCAVVFLALPLAVATSLAMSPAITAAFPFLSGMFGGHQVRPHRPLLCLSRARAFSARARPAIARLDQRRGLVPAPGRNVEEARGHRAAGPRQEPAHNKC